MRLKRVKIFGFKTFADRTEFQVDGDFIAVVGPNGCGKSNLVDAILWGLGEGSAKQLRAHSGTDVIFNGSSRRKPLGYAEVTLLFDNEDGALPVPTSEVAITRRLNRSGGSEYQINRQSCRLRDVLDLLADSGLGRAGYAIVGQKEIDQALAASPEDRRAWVDEAAGVQRYRARKQESLRRLQSAKDHLSRVDDILNEIEGQREPLREEAEVARRYKSALTSLREVESSMLMKEVYGAAQDVEQSQKRIDQAMEMARKEIALAEKLELEARLAGEKVSGLESKMDAIRGRQQGFLTALERADAEVRLARQRLESLDDLESTLGEEASSSKQRLEEASSELELMRREAAIEAESLARVRAECSGAGDDAQALSKALTEVERQLQEARESEARRLKQEAERRHRKERIAQLQRELQGIRASLPDLEKAVVEAEKDAQAKNGDVEASKSGILEARAALKKLAEEDTAAAAQAHRIAAERAALEGRKRGIESTLEAHEGLQQGPKAVLDAVAKGDLDGDFVPVAEAIEVDKRVAVAIETALGASAHDLIVPSETDAKRAIEYLKSGKLGRATFQPVPLMRPLETNDDLEAVLREPGVVGRASDLVRCAADHRPVVESLLGRIVIVESLDVALRLAKTKGWNRLATLEGEILHHRGAVTGGVSTRPTFGVVQRKAELAELNRKIADAETKLEQEMGAASARQKARLKRENQLHELEAALAEREEELREARQWRHSLDAELKEAQRSLDKIESELANLNAAQEAIEKGADVAALEEERDLLLKQLASRSADAEQAEARLKDAESRLTQAEERARGAERRLANARDSESSRERRLQNLGPERKRLSQEIEKALAEREKAQKGKSETDAELAEAQKSKQVLLERSFQISEEIRQARQNAQSSGDAAHQAELARARADAKRASALQRLVEEYGFTESDAMEQGPELEIPRDAQMLVSKLRRELKAMGDVNVGAIEAYERLTARWDELTAQREDILAGIGEVESSIRELDKLTRDRFANTFSAVQESFAEIFQKLFPGGEGALLLSDPDSLLETGIDIDVTLPGKKRQRLELLSGGERSLCATAFLFALLKVKPSPLVVLDEVDAPLDGRNVERYIEMLREFMQTTQFLLITHNPTTIEAAPVWLGVTMQEPGVSTLVPARMPSLEPRTNGNGHAASALAVVERN
jgi:chromosome segregation protein